MHPISGKEHRSRGGGTLRSAHALRAVRQFAWLGVGSVKAGLSHPAWLDLATKRLDEAVFAAYGWQSDLSDEEILEKLLALNLARAKK